MAARMLSQLIPAVATSDGAGVRLRRSLGQGRGARVDPFLMLDEFSSDDPNDYVAGFPSHPHRGFETVTYLLDGHMLHEDHLGHRGDIKTGGVQWMSAGRGIIHSEMPQQKEGRMRGFQLWVNLPGRDKMKPPAYLDIDPADIPVIAIEGGQVKLIAGRYATQDGTITGPLKDAGVDLYYLDVTLRAGATFSQPLPADYGSFVYPFEGEAHIGSGESSRRVPNHSAGVLSDGDQVKIHAGAASVRFLLLAGRALHEPVAQYGPFVMNTAAEIEQALRDYQNGTLALPA